MTSWQSSKNGGAAPLSRRPPTACNACRASKVKCDGQQKCKRCKSRGTTCSYSSPQATSPGNGPADAFIINGQSPPTNNTEIHNFTSQFDIDSLNHIDSLPFGLKDVSTGWSNASPNMTMNEEALWALYPSNGNVSIRISWIHAQRGLKMNTRNLFNLFNPETEKSKHRN